MTTPIIIELGFLGIFPPPGQTYHRQTCPACSPYRRKKSELCHVTEIISDTQARVICYHCTPEWEIVTA